MNKDKLLKQIERVNPSSVNMRVYDSVSYWEGFYDAKDEIEDIIIQMSKHNNVMGNECQCKRGSLFWYKEDDPKNEWIREIYLEDNGSLTVVPQDIYPDYSKDTVNIEINYCPMCGRKYEEK